MTHVDSGGGGRRDVGGGDNAGVGPKVGRGGDGEGGPFHGAAAAQQGAVAVRIVSIVRRS